MTPVHQFVRIGKHSMVGGGSRIPQDVAPFTLVSGNPPLARGLNLVGLSRRGFTPEALEALKRAYRILFRDKLTVNEAVDRIRVEVPATVEIQDLVEFFRTSERGVTR